MLKYKIRDFILINKVTIILEVLVVLSMSFTFAKSSDENQTWVIGICFWLCLAVISIGKSISNTNAARAGKLLEMDQKSKAITMATRDVILIIAFIPLFPFQTKNNTLNWILDIAAVALIFAIFLDIKRLVKKDFSFLNDWYSNGNIRDLSKNGQNQIGYLDFKDKHNEYKVLFFDDFTFKAFVYGTYTEISISLLNEESIKLINSHLVNLRELSHHRKIK